MSLFKVSVLAMNAAYAGSLAYWPREPRLDLEINANILKFVASTIAALSEIGVVRSPSSRIFKAMETFLLASTTLELCLLENPATQSMGSFMWHAALGALSIMAASLCFEEAVQPQAQGPAEANREDNNPAQRAFRM